MTSEDLVIADLAESEATLREMVAQYRLCFVAALHRLAELEVKLRRQADYCSRLVDENRALREQMMRADTKAA